MSLRLTRGSLLDSRADAIVNPANSFLQHGGGLARVIADAAAPLAAYQTLDDAYNAGYDDAFLSMWEQDRAWAMEQAEAPNVPTGGAVLTSPGRLPYKGIIHAVGPIWGGGDLFETELLESAYGSACNVAREAGFESLALPAISAGIFGVPIEVVARCAHQELAWQSDLELEIWLFSDEHMSAFSAPPLFGQD